MDEILNVKDVARLLKVHPMTVYKLIDKGELHGVKRGGQWRFLLSEILDSIKDDIHARIRDIEQG